MIPFVLRVRVVSFVCAAVIYGIWGTPTPDYLGWVEIVVGGFLVLSVGVGGARGALLYHRDDPFWQNAARALLIFGLSVPVVVGVLSGYGALAVLRDVLPFLFMLLPLFMVGALDGEIQHFRFVVVAVVFVGFSFAVRTLAGSDSLYYLVNMPSVLMAEILCAGGAVHVFCARFTVRALVLSLILVGVAMVVMWPVVLTQQRASVGGFGFAFVLVLIRFLWFYPRRIAAIFVALGVGGAVLWPVFEGVWYGLAHKQALVGFNMRFEELAAVWQEISVRPLSLILGKGWGGQFHSPAVADIRVNFTHSLVSSVLLKMGIAGLLVVGLYLYGLFRLWVQVALVQPVLALAVGLPVLIDVFLYASFKSLDFGMVLMLIPAAAVIFCEGKFKRGKDTPAIAF